MLCQIKKHVDTRSKHVEGTIATVSGEMQLTQCNHFILNAKNSKNAWGWLLACCILHLSRGTAFLVRWKNAPGTLLINTFWKLEECALLIHRPQTADISTGLKLQTFTAAFRFLYYARRYGINSHGPHSPFFSLQDNIDS